MKFSLSQLAQYLDQPLPPLILVSGDEPLLVEETCAKLHLQAEQLGFQSLQRFTLDRQFDWSVLFSELNSLSLFSEQKRIQLNLLQGKLNERDAAHLLPYLLAPHVDQILLIRAPKLETAQSRAKWVKAIESDGWWIQIWPLEPRQLPQWIRKRLQQSGLRADQDAIDLLMARTEGNLLSTAQEIEKLALLYPQGSITAGRVMQAVGYSARFTPFDLADSALSGALPRIRPIMKTLLIEGAEPTIILWSLVKELRALLRMAQALEAGAPMDTVLQQAGVWQKRKPLYQATLGRHTAHSLSIILASVAAVDKTLKGIGTSNTEAELLQLAFRLASDASLVNDISSSFNAK